MCIYIYIYVRTRIFARAWFSHGTRHWRLPCTQAQARGFHIAHMHEEWRVITHIDTQRHRHKMYHTCVAVKHPMMAVHTKIVQQPTKNTQKRTAKTRHCTANVENMAMLMTVELHLNHQANSSEPCCHHKPTQILTDMIRLNIWDRHSIANTTQVLRRNFTKNLRPCKHTRMTFRNCINIVDKKHVPPANVFSTLQANCNEVRITQKKTQTK